MQEEMRLVDDGKRNGVYGMEMEVAFGAKAKMILKREGESEGERCKAIAADQRLVDYGKRSGVYEAQLGVSPRGESLR